MTASLEWLGIAELLGDRREVLTSGAYLAACSARIAEREPMVRAWAHLAPPPPDAGEPDGSLPLAGIPVGVKDVYDTADMPTAYGSPIFAGHRPTEDAAAVRRLRAAGALVLGKTATTEFACFHPADTRNPLDPSRTPGGSSSGSAAAVADGMVPAAIGTQTAGSTIRPAAYCGIVGYKPSYGLIDTAGLKPLAPSLDTVGIFARSVEDAARVAAVLAGGGLLPPSMAGAAPRFALFRGPHWDAVSAETRQLFPGLPALLAPAPLREAFSPAVFAGLTAAQKTVMAREAAALFADLVASDAARISEAFLALCRDGAAIGDADYRAALALKAEALEALETAMEEDEILVMPAAPDEAPPIEAGTGDPICNRLWTLLGLPCLTLPLRRSGRLPLGLQLVAAPGRDASLLAAAGWLEGRLRGD